MKINSTVSRSLPSVRCQFEIQGMSCAAEAAGLERRLQHHPGVLSAVVNPLTERAYVVYDPEATGENAVMSAIETAGFRAHLLG